MAVTRITVTGTFVGSDGAPLTGIVRFTPGFDVLVDTVGKSIVDNTPVIATLSATGSFSVPLLPTNAPGVTSTEWTWQVTDPTGRTYSIPVDAATPGGVLNLADVVPAGAASAGTPLLVPPGISPPRALAFALVLGV